MALWPRGHMGQCDKLKIKHLFFCKAYDYQTSQGGDLWWVKLTHNLRWPSNHAITWGHVTNQKLNSSSSTRFVTIIHDRLVTYGKTSPLSLQRFFRARIMVFCLWENALIIFRYRLTKICANFSWVGENIFSKTFLDSLLRLFHYLNFYFLR